MDNEIRKKILDLVHSRPRAISEIAIEIDKNWRTADRYVEQLVSEDLINLHVFRKGGRGALKVAFWPTSISETPSAVKNYLFQKILHGVKKEDFSALDIVQNVPEKNRKIVFVPENEYHGKKNVENWHNKLKKAKKEILFFSGNLSFVNIGKDPKKFIELLSKKMSEGVNLYILTRVDISDKEIINKLLQLNKKSFPGKIEIRYAHQPLRCTIIDEDSYSLKEEFYRYSFGSNEFDFGKKSGVHIYFVTDKEWVNWIGNVFWHLWNGSIDAEKRMEVFDKTINI